jgi:hypothetical protein
MAGSIPTSRGLPLPAGTAGSMRCFPRATLHRRGQLANALAHARHCGGHHAPGLPPKLRNLPSWGRWRGDSATEQCSRPACHGCDATSMSGMRAWMIVSFLGLSIVQQPTARPGAPRLGWPGGCPTAPPMACPRHVAPPHPAVLAHVSRGASRFSCARPARGGAHVGKAVPCSLGGPREAVSGCLREAAGAELRRGRALRRGNTAPGICVRSVGDAERTLSYDAEPRL